jgi:hypothetical protein
MKVIYNPNLIPHLICKGTQLPVPTTNLTDNLKVSQIIFFI